MKFFEKIKLMYEDQKAGSRQEDIFTFHTQANSVAGAVAGSDCGQPQQEAIIVISNSSAMKNNCI